MENFLNLESVEFAEVFSAAKVKNNSINEYIIILF